MYIQVLRPVYIRILRIRIYVCILRIHTSLFVIQTEIVAELKLLCKDGKPSEQMST